jgi:hypothetical protein
VVVRWAAMRSAMLLASSSTKPSRAEPSGNACGRRRPACSRRPGRPCLDTSSTLPGRP